MTKVVYFSVRNTEYPRNARVRSYLNSRGYDVAVVPAELSGSGTHKLLSNTRRLWHARRGAEIVVLSEFSLKYAPLTWAIARLKRAVHVVDGFVGRYESEVEDRGAVSSRSVKGRALWLMDRTALRLADVYLIDTDVRAERARKNARSRTAVITLPVGAPSWAQPQALPADLEGVQILYYGNYIPLHGIEYAVEAIAGLPSGSAVRLTLLGTESRGRALVDALPEDVRHRFTVLAPVPENELAEIISRHHLVLGIFGTSPKAASVLANKVWQGLAAGRTVLTRDSPALAEISTIVGPQLRTVPAGSSKDLAEQFAVLTSDLPSYPESASGLEEYVRKRFAALVDELESRSSPSRRTATR